MFERQLLRKGLGDLARERHQCAECGRVPLSGERVHLYDSALVCALCRPRRGQDPRATELVRHSERGHSVRPLVRAA